MFNDSQYRNPEIDSKTVDFCHHFVDMDFTVPSFWIGAWGPEGRWRCRLGATGFSKRSLNQTQIARHHKTSGILHPAIRFCHRNIGFSLLGVVSEMGFYYQNMRIWPTRSWETRPLAPHKNKLGPLLNLLSPIRFRQSWTQHKLIKSENLIYDDLCKYIIIFIHIYTCITYYTSKL